MEIIKEWQNNLLNRPTIGFTKPVVTDGEQVAHLGPRNDFARVKLRFEPADSFSVSFEGVPTDSNSQLFAQAALFGSLDILMTCAKYPILKVRLIIEQIEVDEINSNELAFRIAGRDAAKKALVESGLLK